MLHLKSVTGHTELGEKRKHVLERIIYRAKGVTYAKFVIVKFDLMNHTASWPLGTHAVAYAYLCPNTFFFSFNPKWNTFQLCFIFLFLNANEILFSCKLSTACGLQHVQIFALFSKELFISGNHLYKQCGKITQLSLTSLFIFQDHVSPGWG